MRAKLAWMLTPFLVLCMSFSFGQEKTVSGNVTDQNSLPLPGVSIVVVGTSNGTQTDFDGNYTISASEGQVLRFSYIGQATVERTVGASSTINVQMEEDAQALEEVVVVGYGTTTKQAFAGTASVVEAEALEVKSFSNVSQALAGEVAGVSVINTSGQPGTTSTIRVRGYGSVNGNRDPLYVVDGVPFTGSINSINPADIKTTTVLKDATATAIYGSRGANGVILITTKSGSANESYIEVDVKSGFNMQLIPRYDVITSPEEYIGYVWEGIRNGAALDGEEDPVAFANDNLFSVNYVHPGYNMWNVADGGELIDPATSTVRPGVTRRYTPQRYADLAFDAAIRTETNLRMAGGDEKSKYFTSIGYLNDNGYALNTGYQRYTARLNADSQVKKWLKVGVNAGYAYSKSQNNGQTVGSENLFEFADKMAPIFPVFLRDENYQLVEDPIFGGYQYDYGTASGFRSRPNADQLNPIASALYDFVGTNRHEINGNFSLDVDIAKGLTFETRFGAQFATERYKSFTNPFYGGGISTGGSLFQRDRNFLTTNFLKLLRYQTEFGSHSIEALVAHENNQFEREQSVASKRLAVHPDIYELNNFVVSQGPPSGFSRGYSIESYFGQVNYDYDKKYFLTASVRRDGSSRFINEKWGTFGSVGAAWVITNEDFMSGNGVFDFLKLKASYGVTGDQAVDDEDYYIAYDTYDINNLNDQISLSIRDNGNPDLTWETSKMFQTGVEFGLGRYLDGVVDFYSKKTDNLIFERRVGPSQGIAIVTVNDGELLNQGIEFNLTSHIFNKEDFKLDFSINGSHINNEILTMPLEPSTGEPRILDTSSTPYGYSKGSSIYDFYIREWAGVNPENGVGQYYQYFNDANGNGTLDDGEDGIADMMAYMDENPDANIERQITETYADATQKYVGKSGIPDLFGAFRLAAQVKNFDFSAQFTYSVGGWAMDNQYSELMSDNFGAASTNFHKDISQRWQNPGDVTDVPRLDDATGQDQRVGTTRWLTSTDYLAFNNAKIGYTLPKKDIERMGLKNVNIWLSGDNLAIKTARQGFNPSVRENGASARRIYAPLTTVTLGVRVKF
ncbi:SusC/RagA family TonB-linked outer membrane protein [Flagellimonas halotolerans]|uniref:SusC/RagA family TonB-linked outer membrane protein n=1 Tax=Flagellimonas halotolerans TaxID=3112164 RepID=A0ABU6ITL3_9FLAO|nr:MULTISPECIES: SusC/RagA family TonB-linked outer membrane protein [unclassified Allomuricauda]MEC3966537.1 SusC/RagA family TonB-linked outer membrane protein [Muricauda sp. SYSU M86414]MEC4266326.1 SusC/RagA family TonB-linked outer membrane protein [Muricauda sp. SYSU M84420]